MAEKRRPEKIVRNGKVYMLGEVVEKKKEEELSKRIVVNGKEYVRERKADVKKRYVKTGKGGRTRDKVSELKQAYMLFGQSGNWSGAVGCAVRLYEIDKGSNYDFLVGVRERICKDKSVGEVDRSNLLERTYMASAREKFNDFMLALEWRRDPQEKFWLPRQKRMMWVCNALQDLEDGKLEELILSMPPRVGKTTIVMFFVLWVMLRHPESSNLYCSYSDTVVKTFYQGLIEILGDEATYQWKQIFPERTLASTNAKEGLINIDRMKRYASFTGRSLYGTLNGAVDCNGYSIADDLISGIEEAMNKDRLMSAWAKVQNNYLPRGKEGCKHLWIGTRWSLTDPTGMRLDLLQNDYRFRSVKWRVINVPALNRYDMSNFDFAMGVGFSTETYQQRRASFERNNDMASWLAQFMGEPIERDGAVFNPEEMRYYNGILPQDIDPDRIFMAVDPAWGGGDFVAAPVCYQYGQDIYVADVVYDNGDKSRTQPLIVKKAKQWNVQAIYVEATKMTAEFADGIDDELKSQNHRVNVVKSTSHFTGTGKVSRIFDKAPDIRERMIFLDSGKRDKAYAMFMTNVFSFSITGKNKNDDAPDSLAMAIVAANFGETRVKVMKRPF